jgi:hypothetical protein
MRKRPRPEMVNEQVPAAGEREADLPRLDAQDVGEKKRCRDPFLHRNF